MKNQHILLFDAIDNDILAHGETVQAGTQILLSVGSIVRDTDCVVLFGTANARMCTSVWCSMQCCQ
jgi:hypothetical protein